MGIFGRSLDHLALLANHSLAAPTNANDRTPRRIIYPTDFFPIPDPAHQQLIDLFIEKLETLVGTKKDPLSLDKLWDESRPPQSSSAGHTLREFMQKVVTLLFVLDIQFFFFRQVCRLMLFALDRRPCGPLPASSMISLQNFARTTVTTSTGNHSSRLLLVFGGILTAGGFDKPLSSAV